MVMLVYSPALPRASGRCGVVWAFQFWAGDECIRLGEEMDETVPFFFCSASQAILIRMMSTRRSHSTVGLKKFHGVRRWNCIGRSPAQASVSPNMSFIWTKWCLGRVGIRSVALLTPRFSRRRYPPFCFWVWAWISGANAEETANMCNFSPVSYDFFTTKKLSSLIRPEPSFKQNAVI